MRAALLWLRRGAEIMAVGLLAAMFVSFLLQIFFRYVVNQPLSWTLEASLLTWLWIVFWGGAFLLRDRDHVRFDIFYAAAGPRLRRVFAAISAVAVVASFALAYPATVDFVAFMKIERSSSLGIRLDYVFAAYLIFAAAVIARYALRLFRALAGGDVDGDAGMDAGPGAGGGP